MRLQVTVEDCYCNINLKAQPHSSILTFSEAYIPIFFIFLSTLYSTFVHTNSLSHTIREIFRIKDFG